MHNLNFSRPPIVRIIGWQNHGVVGKREKFKKKAQLPSLINHRKWIDIFVFEIQKYSLVHFYVSKWGLFPSYSNRCQNNVISFITGYLCRMAVRFRSSWYLDTNFCSSSIRMIGDDHMRTWNQSSLLKGTNPKLSWNAGVYNMAKLNAKGTATPNKSQGFLWGPTFRMELFTETVHRALMSSIVTNVVNASVWGAARSAYMLHESDSAHVLQDESWSRETPWSKKYDAYIPTVATPIYNPAEAYLNNSTGVNSSSEIGLGFLFISSGSWVTQ